MKTDAFLAGNDLNPSLMDDAKEAIKLGREAAYEKVSQLDDQYMAEIASGKDRYIEIDKKDQSAQGAFDILLDQTQEFELQWKNQVAQLAGCLINPKSGRLQCETESNFEELVGDFMSGFNHGFAHFILQKTRSKNCECGLEM